MAVDDTREQDEPTTSDTATAGRPVERGTTRRVTLVQVAAHAGVSPTAASFVLSGRGQDQRISEETQQRVRAAAEELAYRPNLMARILQTGTSGTIALISEYLSTTPYASAAVKGALEAAARHDVLVYIAETLGDPESERRLLQGMIDRRVDGFIYAAMFTHQVDIPKLLHDVPLVLMNCVSSDVDAPAVVPDDPSAGATAARALLDGGHRQGIYFVGALPAGVTGGAQWGGREARALPDRLRGIRRELKRAGTALAGSLVVSDWEPSEGREAVAGLLARGEVPRALICGNDRIAMGAYQALGRAGLRIPEDVSVISFDDSDLAGWLEPGLTSVALPHAELGRQAVELLLSSRAGTGLHRVPMPLSTRASVGAPPHL